MPRQKGKSQESDRQRLNRLLATGQDSDRQVKTKVFGDQNPMPVPLEVLQLELDQAAEAKSDKQDSAAEAAAEKVVETDESAAEEAVGTGSKVLAQTDATPSKAPPSTPEDPPAEICPPETLAAPGDVPADLILEAKALAAPVADSETPAVDTKVKPASAEQPVDDEAAPSEDAAETSDAGAEPDESAPATENVSAEAKQATAETPSDTTQDAAGENPASAPAEAQEAVAETSEPASTSSPNETDEEGTSPPESQTVDSQKLLNDAINSLRAEVQEDSLDELTLSMQQMRLQLLELAAKQVTWSKTPAVREYVEQQMKVLQMLVGDETLDEVAAINQTVELATDSAWQLNAAADLAVQHLSFCTDVTSFGHYRKFPATTFRPGQEAVLYFELDHFVAQETNRGFETEFRVRYDILDSQGHRVTTQVLPTDRQACKVERRDYFIAYLIYLPQIPAGDYTLALQVEDAKGQKHGQAKHAFQLRD